MQIWLSPVTLGDLKASLTSCSLTCRLSSLSFKSMKSTIHLLQSNPFQIKDTAPELASQHRLGSYASVWDALLVFGKAKQRLWPWREPFLLCTVWGKYARGPQPTNSCSCFSFYFLSPPMLYRIQKLPPMLYRVQFCAATGLNNKSQ